MGSMYVNHSLMNNLRKWESDRPGSPPVPVRKLGISHVRLATPTEGEKKDINPYAHRGGYAATRTREKRKKDDDVRSGIGGGTSLPPELQGDIPDRKVTVWETPFTVEFAWTPTPEEKRPAKDPWAAAAPAPAGAAKDEETEKEDE